MTTGWTINPQDRQRLLGLFPPYFSQIVADHVTLHASHAAHEDARPPLVHGRIVGRALALDGVEALIVEIAGTTARPAGGHFHITWSLAPGRTAKESNHVIAQNGWDEVCGGDITLHPADWRSSE